MRRRAPALLASISIAFAAIAIAPSVRAERAPDPPPTPARAAPVASEKTVTDKDEDAEHVGIGALGGVGFPRPLSIEALLRIEQTVALGVEYSALPKMTIAGVDARMWALAADVRFFPFRGAFFIGARGGLQRASASTTVSVPTLGSVSEEIDVETIFINPRLGFLWGRAPGLMVGIEAGVQIPLSHTVSSSLPSQALASQGVTNVTDIAGKSVLPTVDLLRLGFMF